MTQRRSLWLVVFTVAVDAFGFGILLPVIPQLLTNPRSPLYLLSPDTPAHTGYLLIGVLTALYPLMQFFSTPILGQLSDRYGRKPVLALSLAGTSLGYVMFAYGVITRNIELLFVARALDGLTGGNVSVAHAVIADVTKPEERTKSFGLAMGAFGIGMIVGPLTGGTLADSSVVSWFSASTPFWFAAIVAALNTASIWLMLPETGTPKRAGKVQLAKNLANIARAYARPKLRGMFVASFFSTTGNALFIAFFGVFLIDRFAFDQSQIARFFGYTGLCVIFTQFVTLPRMAKRFTEVRVLRVTLIATAAMVGAYLVPRAAWWIFVIAPFVSTFNGLSLVNLRGLMSRTAGSAEQGEVMGIAQSIQALATALPPLLAGSIASVLSPPGIIAASAVSHVLGWLTFAVFYRDDTMRGEP